MAKVRVSNNSSFSHVLVLAGKCRLDTPRINHWCEVTCQGWEISTSSVFTWLAALCLVVLLFVLCLESLQLHHFTESLQDLEKSNKRKVKFQATEHSTAVAHLNLCLGNVNEPKILPIIRWGNCLYFQTDDAAIMKRLTGNLGVSTLVIWFMLKQKCI